MFGSVNECVHFCSFGKCMAVKSYEVDNPGITNKNQGCLKTDETFIKGKYLRGGGICMCVC